MKRKLVPNFSVRPYVRLGVVPDMVGLSLSIKKTRLNEGEDEIAESNLR